MARHAHPDFRAPRPGISIAVVQNASELVHYAYADTSRTFQELGCNAFTYTDYSIERLVPALKSGRFEVLVFAANAFNSGAIRAAFDDAEVAAAVREFVENGGGLLILHQLRIARNNYPLPAILPDKLRTIRAIERPAGEAPAAGNLELYRVTSAKASKQHVVLAAPNRLDIANVQRISATHPEVPALYWHSWDGVAPSWWDVLVADTSHKNPRCLVAATKERDPWRVVIASIPLPWHRSAQALCNIVSYLADGRPSTVVLANETDMDITTRVLLVAMRTAGIAFQVMRVGQDDEQFIDGVRGGVFDTVLICQDDDLPDRINQAVDTAVKQRLLEVISVPPREPESVLVSGDTLRLHEITSEHISECIAMCNSGLVDGSYWATVDALRAVYLLPDGPQAVAGVADALGRLLEGAESSDGSFDGVFAATVGLVWLKVHLNARSQLRRTLDWIEGRLASATERDKLYYWYTFESCSLLSGRERATAVSAIAAGIPVTTQPDLVLGAECAFVLGELAACERYLEQLSLTLQTATDEDRWVDLGLAGDTLRISARLIFEHGSTSAGVVVCLESALAPLLKWLYSAMHDENSVVKVGGSMRVTSKVMAGLVAYSNLGPVAANTVVDLLSVLSVAADRWLVRKGNASLVDALRAQRVEIAEELRLSNSRVAAYEMRSKRLRSLGMPVLVLSALMIYISATLIYSGVVLSVGGLGRMIAVGFVQPFYFHLTLIGTIATVLGGVFAYRQVADARRVRGSHPQGGQG